MLSSRFYLSLVEAVWISTCACLLPDVPLPLCGGPCGQDGCCGCWQGVLELLLHPEPSCCPGKGSWCPRGLSHPSATGTLLSIPPGRLCDRDG